MIGGVVAGLALAAWVTVGPTVIVTEHVPLATIVEGERPALRGLLEESEVALVNCRTRSDRYGARQINRTAYLLAAASGLRLPTRPIESPVRVNGELVYASGPIEDTYGTLARCLAAGGYRAVASWGAGTGGPEGEPDPGLLAMGPDGVAVLDEGHEDATPVTILSVAPDHLEAAIVPLLEEHRRSGQPLFLLTMPPRGTTWNTERTALFAWWGGGPGLLGSPTTRRPGLIRVTDVAPTILNAVGIDPPLDIEGRAALGATIAGPVALERLHEMQRRALRAELGRGAIFDALMGAATLTAIISLALWGFGERGPGSALGRGIAYGLLLAPAVLAVAPLLTDSTRYAQVVAASLTVAALLGLALAALLPSRWGLLIALTVTPAVLIADQLLGGNAAAYSYLGYSLQRDSRLYGIGNSMAVLTVVGTLLLVGALTEAWPRGRGVWWLLLAAPAFVIGAPQLGANTGGLLTATFALALAAGLAARSPRARWAIFLLAPLLAGATVIGAALYDVLTHPDPTTHLGHAMKQVLSGQDEWLRRTMQGKVALVKERFSTPLWWGSVGTTALFLPFVVADSPPPAAWAPPLRYVVAGAMTALFAGLVNDSGIVMTSVGCLPCIAGAALSHRRVRRRSEPRYG